jgi:hypothetical protein
MKPQSAKRFDDLVPSIEAAFRHAREQAENRSLVATAVDKSSRNLAGLRAARVARRGARK